MPAMAATMDHSAGEHLLRARGAGIVACGVKGGDTKKTLSQHKNIKNTIMKHYTNAARLLLMAALAASAAACSDDDNISIGENEEAQNIGKAVGNFSAEEWYPGGKLGTTDNTGSNAYSDQTPEVDNDPTLFSLFFQGEQMFERQFTTTTAPFKGLGPASVRKSCIDCHPEYGHGKRMTQYETKYSNGNGYLLVVYHPKGADAENSDGWSNDGPYVSEVTGMPQTQASAPFKAPIDESQIQLKWLTVDKMESGLPMKFPDGETFQLIYPDIRIPQTAFHTSPTPYETGDVAVRLESTIGVIGTGLIDAIPQDSIRAQYAKTAKYFQSQGLDVTEYVNPSFWNATTQDWGPSALYSNWGATGHQGGQLADGTKTTPQSYKSLKRFTYALTRASLQDGPGANAIWNITNVSRPDRPYLYTTKAWAKAMSQDPEVIAAIKADPTSPYYADGTEEGIKEAVYNLLLPTTNQFDNQWHNFQPDMTADQFHAFMVWHRGLAIPRARNLQDADVQRGKKIFNEIGCTACHRPRWHTTTDNYWVPEMIAGKPLPRYQNQTIFPYSDFMQHKLYLKNDIHGSWCRTTPLWGRGLSLLNTGAEDRMHDCRARNEVEAIMWHAYSKKSHAYQAALRFYNLPKADRDAVVKFLRAI